LTDYFLDFARLGADWVMVLLIALSILSVGVMIDRFLWFRHRDTDTEKLTRELRGAFDRGELDRLMTKYKDSPAVPVQVAMRGVEVCDRGAAAAAEAMHAERLRWRRAGDQNLLVLGTLGNTVPFVGLFGTVLGVIKAFDRLTGHSADAEALVVEELAKALTATAVGLIVAIPAVVAFNYFSRRLRVALAGGDECAHAVLGMIYGREVAGLAARAPASEAPSEAVKEAAKEPAKEATGASAT
jgi:biopolymer transport protein ExbB